MMGSMSVIAIFRQLRRLLASWRLGLLPVCRQTGSWQPDPITNPTLFAICCLAWQLSANESSEFSLNAESWNRGWSVVLIN
jgi:hypothetical protein